MQHIKNVWYFKLFKEREQDDGHARRKKKDTKKGGESLHIYLAKRTGLEGKGILEEEARYSS